ncbi:hypothetical protein M752DRAFT_5505 [Aspergillus phoenicis ATCC 13157]|uniref:Uncharacterized protein n=1 Tax=Aspergillus phoenicis ATCC 13157 TaxID=1353007 RepID=A0A370Q034_ASPPH|nr:hypothetical protein M752DRAFT_5505 [Aspergillus phoenicis ATCC 13157]
MTEREEEEEEGEREERRRRKDDKEGGMGEEKRASQAGGVGWEAATSNERVRKGRWGGNDVCGGAPTLSPAARRGLQLAGHGYSFLLLRFLVGYCQAID